MSIRTRILPAGWYPAGRSQTIDQIEEFLGRTEKSGYQARAGVVPHAGWAFSGAVALEVLRTISEEIETIVVVGGHLLPHQGVLAALEDKYETPLSEIEADKGLLQELKGKIDLEEDNFSDNTVEIQLPFIKYLFPGSRALSLRAAPSQESIHLGEALAEIEKESGKNIAVIGSTDLTHYGPNYGFTPKGTGKEAYRWVREINDKRVVDTLLALDCREAIKLANKEKSACSIGGAAAAAGFARKKGVKRGKLLHYTTSYDIYPGDSFVGYAGIIYPEREE